jgi:hypothetical protein
MKLKKLQALLLIAVLMIGFVVVLLPVFRVDPHELTQPLTILGAQAWADGGSIQLEVRGANGKRLAIERVGSLEVERSQQKMYLVNAVFWFFPWRRVVERGSALETETHEMLETWLKESLPPKQRELLKRNDPLAFQETPGEVVMAYDIATWVTERH